ncbi:hypothetical protein J1614_004872 [Plenodomus biglobosus]|nr:hypothetical protein J1614_004872 [Plenodomus biglobosus]
MSECRYDCAENRTLAPIPEYSDISGIGVVIAYTFTAGLTVLIITTYYFVAHQAELDPFRTRTKESQGNKALYTPHPVDSLILRVTRSTANRWLHWVRPKAKETTSPTTASANNVASISSPPLTPQGSQTPSHISPASSRPHSQTSLEMVNIPVARTNPSVSTTSPPPKLPQVPTKEPSSTVRAFTKCVLLMSDIQILTGLSILTSGYTQLHCGLSVYHWQILVYLTWFCSLTHLSCLTFLRTHLHNHPGERWWRLIAMGLLVAMLIAALLPTGNYGSRNDPSNYAICSFRKLAPAGGGSWYTRFGGDAAELDYAAMIISVLLIGLGYVSRIVRLHPALSVWWLVASYIWGVYNLKMSLSGYAKSPPDNNVWTFGQIAPIILLIAPILSMIESRFEIRSHDKEQTSDDNTNENDPAIAQVPSRTETVQVATSTLPIAPDGVQDHPDHDFYQDHWYKSLVFFAMLVIICVTIVALFMTPLFEFRKDTFSKGAQISYLIPSANILLWPPVSLMLSFMSVVLYCLLFDNLNWHHRALRCQMWTVNMVIYTFFPLISDISMNAAFAMLGFIYIVLSLFYVVRAKRRL